MKNLTTLSLLFLTLLACNKNRNSNQLEATQRALPDSISVTDVPIVLKNITIDELYFTKKTERYRAISKKDFVTLQLDNIISAEALKAPNSQVKILDTLLNHKQGKMLIIAKENDNETEAYMVQYSPTNQLLFWDIVYYADFVEYFKTINTTVLDKELLIKTDTDMGEGKSSKTKKYVLTQEMIFERNNK